MKKIINFIKYIVWANILVLMIFIYSLISCNDSGVLPSSYKSGRFIVSQTGLKPLVDSLNGLYQLWLILDSSGSTFYYHISTFNIDGRGNFVDQNGNPANFTYTGDTNNLTRPIQLLLTVEPLPVGPLPGPIHLLSAPMSVFPDTLSGTLTIGGDSALGAVGMNLIHDNGRTSYTLQTPTSPNPATCLKGLWFCDSLGVSTLPSNIVLPINSPFVYQGWVADTSNPSAPVYYSTGRFRDPNSADNDGAGPCAGPNQPWNKPGQDWVTNGCQMPDLNDGHHQVFITLEPANEQPGSTAYNTPFFFKVFWQPIIAGACKQADYYFVSQHNSFPTLHVVIQL